MANKINVIKKIIVGSVCFFKQFEDFKPKDIDELWIIGDSLFSKCKSLLIHGNNKDIILYQQLSKDEFIENDLEINDSIKLGKYLVKDFVEYIGLTMNDLLKLRPLYDKLDEKHQYQKLIYDSYIENNSFMLTDKQLNEIYELYKKYRK